jgi:hypothetical protein
VPLRKPVSRHNHHHHHHHRGGTKVGQTLAVIVDRGSHHLSKSGQLGGGGVKRGDFHQGRGNSLVLPSGFINRSAFGRFFYMFQGLSIHSLPLWCSLQPAVSAGAPSSLHQSRGVWQARVSNSNSNSNSNSDSRRLAGSSICSRACRSTSSGRRRGAGSLHQSRGVWLARVS